METAMYIWVACVLLLLGYYLLMQLPFVANLTSFIEPTPSEIPVSVIVCGKNEAENIAENLPHVLEQKYAPGFEVIFVNDASIDATEAVLSVLCEKHKHLRVIDLQPREKKAAGKKGAVEAGIAFARHEHLVFTDADCQPVSNNWLSQMAARFEEAEVILGYGPLWKRKGLLNKLCRWEAFNVANQYYSFLYRNLPYMGVGRNLAYTKTYFKKINGFDNHKHIPSGDDDLLVAAHEGMGRVKPAYEEDSFVYSEAPETWSNWFTQKERHLSTAYHYPLQAKVLLTILGGSNLLFYLLLPVSILFWPTLTLIFLVIKLMVQWMVNARALKHFKESGIFLLIPLYEFISLLATTVLHAKKYTVGLTVKWK